MASPFLVSFLNKLKGSSIRPVIFQPKNPADTELGWATGQKELPGVALLSKPLLLKPGYLDGYTDYRHLISIWNISLTKAAAQLAMEPIVCRLRNFTDELRWAIAQNLR